MDVEAYLERIGHRGPAEATAATLRALHVAHLRSVPFENLDLHLGRPVSLELEALFEKVVVRRRGGFCYELNGLFAELLRALGFEVALLAARVWNEGRLGPEFDHLALRVEAEGAWLADVGFGDSFLEPRPLAVEGGGTVAEGAYRVVADGELRWLEERRGGAWGRRFRFDLVARELADFRATCRWHESSPDSPFTRGTVCSRATVDGRVTISGDRFVRTRRGRREERAIADVDELRSLLAAEFGITLGADEPLEATLR